MDFKTHEIANSTTHYIIADSIHHKFDESYSTININTWIITILDSHVKCSIFKLGDETNNAISLIHNKMDHYTTTVTDSKFFEHITFNRIDAHAHLRIIANQFSSIV